MIKIGVMLNLKPNVGGSYQYWMTILKALNELDSDKYEVYAIYENDEWMNILSRLGVKTLQYRKKKKKFAAAIVERLVWKYNSKLWRKCFTLMTNDLKNVKHAKIDIIFSDTAMGITEVLKTKTIIPIHDLMHRYETDVIEMQEGYEYREHLYRSEIPLANLILVDSELGAKHVCESYGDLYEGLENKIAVLPFIAPPYIYEDTKEKEISVELPDKYLFYPAQFWSHKNHVRLLHSIADLRDQGIEVPLVLVGSEQNNSTLIEKTIKELNLSGLVLILGYVSNSEMMYLYRRARALVMPTLFGPTNIPPLEAFALGCPVITSNIYAIPNQLGDAALYFNPRDEKDIAQCIKKIWLDDSLCEELIKSGKRHSKEWGPLQFAERIKDIMSKYYE